MLHFLRQALGTQTAPSNQVMLGLALFLSLLVMQPVIKESYEKGVQPLEQGKITRECGLGAGLAPAQELPVAFRPRKRHRADD